MNFNYLQQNFAKYPRTGRLRRVIKHSYPTAAVYNFYTVELDPAGLCMPGFRSVITDVNFAFPPDQNYFACMEETPRAHPFLTSFLLDPWHSSRQRLHVVRELTSPSFNIKVKITVV